MKNKFRNLIIAGTGLIIIMSLTAAFSVTNAGSETKMPQFELSSVSGKTFNSNSLAGSYVVIHIATTWCPYCRAEAPYLEQLSQDYQNKNVKVLLIDVKEARDLVNSKLKEEFSLTFPVLLDEDGTVASAFAPADVLPEMERDEIMLAANIIIDPRGTIRYMSLLDTRNFDSKLIHIKKKLDEMLLSH